MNSVTVDELVMRIEVELDRFRAQAGQAEAIDKKLRQSLKNTEKTAKQTGEGFDELGGSIEGSNKQLESKLKTLATATRRLVGFFAVITGSNAIQRLATSIADANDQLRFLSQRLGMAAGDVKKLDNAVAALGGTNAQAVNTIKSLNQGIQEMVIMGNDSLIPFFGALGVGVTDAAGNVRAMDDILLDMADSLSRMDPQRAYAIASAMGLDDGVANALIQGRDAMQEMLDMQKTLYVSTQAELDASRELNRALAFLGKQWEGLKTIIGNAIIPHLLKMTKIVSGWLEYLHRNERTVRNFFEGMAIALGVVLIPLLVKGALAMLAFVAPVLAAGAAVGLLALGFAALYDDYKTWAEGGKSLFDWSGFVEWIDKAEFSVDGLAKGFTHLLTGYKTWAEAGNALFDWAKSKGLIDANGLAVKNLGNAIKGLAKDAIESVPLLKALVDVVALVLEGKWSEAASRLMDVPGLALQAGYDITGFVAERGASAIDRTFGIDPGSDQSAAGAVRSLRNWGSKTLERLLGKGTSLDDKYARAEAAAGLPSGLIRAIQMQETGGNQSYVDDPEKYHYGLNSEGRRVAPHTGKISTAFGPFGILESTAKDPGFGVKPLQDKSLDEQIRFVSEYLAARIKHSGSLRGGLAGYGEGTKYADSVIRSLPGGAASARGLTQGYIDTRASTGGTSRSMEVNIGSVNVQTSATTLPAATSDGVAAGIKQSNELLNQLAGGIQ